MVRFGGKPCPMSDLSTRSPMVSLKLPIPEPMSRMDLYVHTCLMIDSAGHAVIDEKAFVNGLQYQLHISSAVRQSLAKWLGRGRNDTVKSTYSADGAVPSD